MNKNELLSLLEKEEFSELIISAFRSVDREKFITAASKRLAYENTALPTAGGSTISQPSTIAFMISLLELEKLSRKKNITNTEVFFNHSTEKIKSKSVEAIKILEIGSGSGYVLALMEVILKNINMHQYTLFGLEIINELVKKSRTLLQHNTKIKIFKKDGSKGFAEEAPFDCIIVSAAFSNIPAHLFDQLSDEGILVCPVQNSIFQFKKINGTIEKREFEGFVFVPILE